MNRTNLNIYAYQESTHALGPGKRFALWVQGCPFNCKGCMTPDSTTFVRNKVYSVKRIAKKILNVPDLNGITISGGEPFMQAEQLKSLIEILKSKKPSLNYIVYSGFKIERLKWHAATLLLNEIDVLIDGLYVEKLNDNKGLRGSVNQKSHFITDRLLQYNDHFHLANRSQEEYSKRDGKLFVGLRPKLKTKIL